VQLTTHLHLVEKFLYMLSQSVQSRSHKIERKFVQNRHSVIVDISQYDSLLSKVSLRSVTL